VLIGRFAFCAYGCNHTSDARACVKSRCMGIVKTCAQR
jgi:hypothetical protein